MINTKKPQKYQFHHYSHHHYDQKTGAMHHKKDKIQTMKFDDCPLTEPDQAPAWKTGEKYSLRQRQQRHSTRKSTAAAAAAATAAASLVVQTSTSTEAIETQSSASSTPATTSASSTVTGSTSSTTSNSSKRKEKAKPKAAPLSKYRRKTANARERTRMREINSAFENLRKCVPVTFADAEPSTATCSEKLTKITTLRLAMKYIQTLNEALHSTAESDKIQLLLNSILTKHLDSDQDMSDNSINNNNLEMKNNNSISMNTNATKTSATAKSKSKSSRSKKNDSSSISLAPNKSTTNRKRTTSTKAKPAKSEKRGRVNKKFVNYLKSDLNSIGGSSITSSPVLDDSNNPIDLGLMLESDGESLHLSEPCLSPLSTQQLKPFACTMLETTKNLNNNNISSHHNNNNNNSNNNNILMNNNNINGNAINNNNITNNSGNNFGSIDIGLFLESDTDSLQFSEPCLSPLGGFDAFGPFGDLLHSGFTEQSSLDIYLT